MSSETASRDYGPNFYILSLPEQKAVERYIDKLARKYPELAENATAGPGFDGEVYVYVSFPDDEDEDMLLHKAASRITHEILMDRGVSILLMPDRMFTNTA